VMPRPKVVYGIALWDRNQIDVFVDRLETNETDVENAAQYGTDEVPPWDGSDVEFSAWGERIRNSALLRSEREGLAYMACFADYANVAGSKRISKETVHRLLARCLLEASWETRDWPVVRLTAKGRSIADDHKP
ncbi:hypothetical protein AB4144_08710, partial [Rhizobiaceae sp. 2RAB30]